MLAVSLGGVLAAPTGSGPVGLVAVAGAAPLAVATVDGDAPVGNPVGNPLGTDPGEAVGSSAAEDRKVWGVVGALVAVALALTVLTVRYWRQTRPTGTPSARSRRRPPRRRGGGDPAPAVLPAGPDAVAVPRGRPSPTDDDLDDLFVED
jgi:hypothetical protein